MKFYQMLIQLQDATGNVRDIYITYENISLFVNQKNIGIKEDLITKMAAKQKELIEELRILLSSFLKSSELKNFIKLII